MTSREQGSVHSVTGKPRWMLLFAATLGLALAGCASEPPPPEEPVEQEPVSQPEPDPKPEPPRPVFSIEFDYPDGPVTFTSRCDYSAYIGKLRSVHSSDRNVHAVLKHVESQGYGCDGRIQRLEDYLRNLDAL